MIRTLDTERVVYGFDLFIGSDVEEYTGYQQIIQHLWANFGHTVFNEERHLAMPFTEYVRTVQDVTFQPLTVHPPVTGFKDTGSFLEFELNGQKLGGYRSAVPGWLDAIWNCMFWNNARDAAGMYYWGSQLNDQSLIDKARRTINLILLSPGNEYGLFPLIYRAGKNEWQTNSFDVFNRKFGLFSAGSDCQTYDVVSMNLTCAYLIVYYQKCENDDRILSFVKKYGNWVTSIVDEAGVIPSYVSTDMQESEVLKYSAQPAAGMWFLSELYSVTNDTKYLKAAENIAQYLITQIIPRQKWIDMEQYFSCGIKPLNFIGDEEQGQLARGNLSIGWAAKGFASLYRACGKDIYLRAGERCIDYLSFSQCSWDPHFIYTAYPFGGFSVDNSDHATYLDARQAEFVDPYIWYGKVLGRQDLLERGVAAARSSIVLINHPLHKGNSIYEHTNIYPFGLGPENIDHEGHPQSAMRTHPSWGEGSGIFTGLSDAMRELGGAFIDVEKGIMVGVDGVTISGFNLSGTTINISMKPMLSMLKLPWKSPYKINLRITGIRDDGNYDLFVNKKKIGGLRGLDLASVDLIVQSNGEINPVINVE